MKERIDVGIVGGGAMGLWLSHCLAVMGFVVSLIEEQPELASGPSTRNEGWLHRGTYHAAAIIERPLAIRVALQTIAGFRQTLQFAPEAREEKDCESFAVLQATDVKETVDRWDGAGVLYRPVDIRTIRGLDPELNLSRFDAAFRVADVAINSRVVYQKLVREACRRGTQVLTGAQVSNLNDGIAKVRTSDGRERELEARVWVCAAGYGVGNFFKNLLGVKLPMRYFVSHLLDLPRFTKHCFFGVGKNDITLMHHGEFTIVGYTKDQTQVSSPSVQPNPACLHELKAALLEIAPHLRDADFIGRACTKVDIERAEAASGTFGNLNLAYGEPVPGVFWALPGKMTEAPYAAQQLADVIGFRLGSPSGRSTRPGVDPPPGLFPPPSVAGRPIDGCGTLARGRAA